MAGRKAISKKLRFEIFKRDSFTCQYCGKSAPDVILHVDHINPVKSGGKNDILNLITSCIDCNLGKGARELSDNSALSKQQQQLQLINERREQLELMLKWRESLTNIDDQQAKSVATVFGRNTSMKVNARGIQDAKKWIKRYSLEEVLESVELSKTNYIEYDDDGIPTPDSVEKAWTYILRICSCRRVEKDNPLIKEFNYIRGIVRNRCNYYFSSWQCSDLIQRAHRAGVPIEEIAHIAKTCIHWSHWKQTIEEAIEFATEG